MTAAHVFISYKSEDLVFAEALVVALEAVGLNTWAAFKSVRFSHADEIPPAIRASSAVAILMSRRAYVSDEVLDEVFLAREFKKPRLPVLLPGEQDPTDIEDLPDRVKDIWRLERVRRQYHRWVSPEAVADWILAGLEWGSTPSIAPASPEAPSRDGVAPVEVPARPALPVSSDDLRNPLSVIDTLGGRVQLDALHGVGEHTLSPDDSVTGGNLGHAAVAPDASIVATAEPGGQVSLWTVGSGIAAHGPDLSELLPGDQPARLLAVERPLGQGVRIIASRGGGAYSVVERSGGSWEASVIASGADGYAAGAIVLDDVLLVTMSGELRWAGDIAKRPFGLRTVRGVDAAIGPDGRPCVAAWGEALDGSPQLEVVVREDGSWVRRFRGPAVRGGVQRILRDPMLPRSQGRLAVLAESTSGVVEVIELTA